MSVSLVVKLYYFLFRLCVANTSKENVTPDRSHELPPSLQVWRCVETCIPAAGIFKLLVAEAALDAVDNRLRRFGWRSLTVGFAAMQHRARQGVLLRRGGHSRARGPGPGGTASELGRVLHNGQGCGACNSPCPTTDFVSASLRLGLLEPARWSRRSVPLRGVRELQRRGGTRDGSH